MVVVRVFERCDTCQMSYNDQTVVCSMRRPLQPTPWWCNGRGYRPLTQRRGRALRRPLHPSASAEAVGSSTRRLCHHHMVPGRHSDAQEPARRPNRRVQTLERNLGESQTHGLYAAARHSRRGCVRGSGRVYSVVGPVLEHQNADPVPCGGGTVAWSMIRPPQPTH